MDRVRVGFLGVKPEYQHTGVAAKLYVEHFNAAALRPQTGGEMGWILETNQAMNRAMEAMGGRIVKRYRVYERLLESRAARLNRTCRRTTVAIHPRRAHARCRPRERSRRTRPHHSRS